MSTTYRYALPVEQTGWRIDAAMEASFAWEYEDGRARLLNLYDTAKKQQWDAALRIDWDQPLDPGNPMRLDDRGLAIAESPVWARMGEDDRARVRRHVQAHTISQFLHGEQGALMVAARLVQCAPQMDAKFYAATQTMDEARHVEAYSRLLHEKFDLVYPITPGLRSLLDDILSDSRWDMCYLGMQVLIEGLALAAFQRYRDSAQNPLARQVNAYVMQDEARHVAFGRIALRDLYPELTDAERAEREEFVIEACRHMRDRFDQREVWENLGLGGEIADLVSRSETMKAFRRRLFSRIVPVVRDIGLWSPRVRQAFVDMQALEYADLDVDAVLADDARVAEEFDAQRHVERAIAAAPRPSPRTDEQVDR
ncbi:MAG TPA: ferritin-like domain-containing protein [Burkholderiaceae bacterium]|nr:ferritin-like domain-containing protein [Burkholderiaceae bacterium]